jgi:hypothetical protein
MQKRNKGDESTGRAFVSRTATGFSALLLACASAPALAQSPISVEGIDGRTPEDYRPVPILVNAFELSPFIDVETEFVDNIFASDFSDQNDTIVAVLPGLTIRDRREDRQIALRLRAGYETYLEDSIDDRFRLEAAGTARFGLGTLTRTFGGLSVRQNDLQSGGYGNVGRIGQPIAVTSFGANAGLERDIGQLLVTAEGRYLSSRYDGDFIFSDDIIDSGFRDFDVFTALGSLGYNLDASQRIYTQVSYSDRGYEDLTQDLTLPERLRTDRSSTDFNIRAGYVRELTELLQLDVNVGYIFREFTDDSRDSDGAVSFDTRLTWSPTRLTDVEIRGSRSIDTNNDPLFSGLLRTEGSVSVQHELLRNFVIAADGRYADIDLDGTNGSEFGAGLSGRYLLSRKWSVRLRGEYFERDGFFSGDQTRITVGARYNF